MIPKFGLRVGFCRNDRFIIKGRGGRCICQDYGEVLG
jgi:hypothetical protein